MKSNENLKFKEEIKENYQGYAENDGKGDEEREIRNGSVDSKCEWFRGTETVQDREMREEEKEGRGMIYLEALRLMWKVQGDWKRDRKGWE